MKKFILSTLLAISALAYASAQVPAAICVNINNDLSYNNRAAQEMNPVLYNEVLGVQNFLANNISRITGRSYLAQNAVNTGPGFFGRQTALAVWLYQYEQKIVSTRFPRLLNQVTIGATTRAALACKNAATPKVEFLGNPTLGLQYLNGQSTLVGQASVRITAGNVPVYTVNIPYILELLSVEGYPINQAAISRSAVRSVGEGESLPANSSAVFTIALSIPTAQLTSGQYLVSSTVSNQPIPSSVFQGTLVNLIGETGAGLIVTGDVQSGTTIATGDIPVIGDPINVTGDPITSAASEVGPTGAVLNMLFNSMGDAYTTFFSWGTSTAYLNNEVAATKSNYSLPGSPSGYETYSAPILGLYPNTYYYFQAKARGANGPLPGGTFTGNMLSFLTSPETGCLAGYGSVNGKCVLKPVIVFNVKSLLSNAPNQIYATSTVGSPVTLNWSVTNAYTCKASNAWSGTKLLYSAGETYYPTEAATTYTLTCMGDGGETSQSVVVNTFAPSTTPVTQVLSPNGGEVYPFDTSMLIKWKPFTTVDDKVNVFIISDKPSPYGTDAVCIIGTANASAGQFNWSPTRSLSYCNNLPTLTDGSKLKIQLRAFNIMGMDPKVIDQSDNYFSLGTPVPTTPPTPNSPLSAQCSAVDTNGDNMVSMLDLDFVKSLSGKTSTNPFYIARADVDKNGAINSGDILRVRALMPSCYVGPNYAYSISTSASGQFTYTAASKINLTASALTSNGSVASSTGGYQVSGSVLNSSGLVISTIPMTYNSTIGTWEGMFFVPLTTGTYSIQVGVKCAEIGKCSDKNEAGNVVGTVFNIANSYKFVVNGATVTTSAPTLARTAGFVSQTVSPNTSRVKLGSFTVQASTAEHIIVDRIDPTFEVNGYSINNLTNISVMSNGQSVGTTIGMLTGPTASFNAGSVLINAGQTKTYDVYADIGLATSGYVTTSMSLSYRNTAASNPVTSGTLSASGVQIISAASTGFSATLAPSSNKGEFVEGGVTYPIAIYKITTQGAGTSANIKELQFSTLGQDAISSITVNGVTAAAVPGAVTTVTGLNIPVTSSGVEIPVLVKFNSFQNSVVGGPLINSVPTVSVTLTKISGGSGSGAILNSPVSVSSNEFALVASKPSVYMGNGGGALTLGAENKIGEITLTAGSYGDIALQSASLIFTFSGISNPSVSNVRVADGTVTTPGSNATVDGSGTKMTFSFSNGYQIGKGQAKVFSVYGTVNGSAPTGAGITLQSTLNAASTFNWKDVATGSIFTGTKIKNYPTNAFTLMGTQGPVTGGQLTVTEQAPVQKLNAAQFVSQSVPSTMVAGQTYSVSVTMKNTGNTTWTSTGNYKLGSQNPQDNIVWGGRIYLAAGESIAPNASKTFTFNVKAPTNVSASNFQWKMVEESVQWFGESSTNVPVTITQPAQVQAPVAICDYSAPPTGCSWTQGASYVSATNCGMVLVCSAPAPAPVQSVTPVPTQANGVTVSTPNGGETYKAGASMTVTWKTKGIDSSNNSLGLNVYDITKGPSGAIVSTSVANPVSGGVVSESGSYTFTIPAGTSGKFTVYMSSAVNWDESDTTFTINP